MKAIYTLIILFSSSLLKPATPELSFKENKGQWPSNTVFATEFLNTKVYLNKTGFLYSIYDLNELNNKHHHDLKNDRADELIHAHAYEMIFEGAVFSGTKQENARPEYYNYFLGNDRSKWATDVKSFKKITYNNLYPNTNLIVYSNGLSLKYDFELSANANPSLIKLKYNYINSLEIKNEDLIIKTSVGEVIETKPYAYQIIEGKKIEVKCKYVKGNASTISFEFPEGYNKNYKLIIDPTVVVCSYSGANSWADNFGSTYDKDGCIYVYGNSLPNYPTSTGAYMVNVNGSFHIIISKYNSTGSTKLFSTYMGGDDGDYPICMIVKNNEMILMGVTRSANFPVSPDAFGKTFKGGGDIFIAKLTSTGNSFIAAAVIGGKNWENSSSFNNSCGEITVDAQGNIYCVSNSTSKDFPVTVGSASTAINGMCDAIAFKTNTNLSTLIWSTYFGGALYEDGKGIRCDGNGGVFCFGTTNSLNFPTTAGSISTVRKGYNDMFMTHLDANGAIIASTYFGSTGNDQAGLMDMDHNGNLYVCGTLSNPSVFIPTSGVYNNVGGCNAIYKIDNALSNVIYKTKVGFSGIGKPVNLEFTAFKVDSCQNVYIAGYCDNVMPTTSNAIMPYSGDKSDMYMAVFKTNCSSLYFGSYFGGPVTTLNYGEHTDGGLSYFDDKGILYQGICTSGGLPTTSNAFAPVMANSSGSLTTWNDAFLKVDLQTFIKASSSFGAELNGCVPFSNTFSGFSNTGTYSWNFGDGSPISNLLSVSHTYTAPGIYNSMLILVDLNTCNQTDSVKTKVTVATFPTVGISPNNGTICIPGCVQFNSESSLNIENYSWQMDNTPVMITGTGKQEFCFNEPGKHTLVHIGYNNGCNDTVRLVFNAMPKPVADFVFSPDEPAEYQTEVTFTDASHGKELSAWKWYFNSSTDPKNVSYFQNPVYDYNTSGSYNTMLVVTNSYGCSDTIIKTILVKEDFEVYVPNAFTPNGDGLNDIFTIKGIGIKTFELEIYDRTGSVIFKTNDISNGWNGKFRNNRGDVCELGTYTWKVIATNSDNKAKWLNGSVIVMN